MLSLENLDVKVRLSHWFSNSNWECLWRRSWGRNLDLYERDIRSSYCSLTSGLLRGVVQAFALLRCFAPYFGYRNFDTVYIGSIFKRQALKVGNRPTLCRFPEVRRLKLHNINWSVLRATDGLPFHFKSYVMKYFYGLEKKGGSSELFFFILYPGSQVEQL
jgi:hypothetical protein